MRRLAARSPDRSDPVTFSGAVGYRRDLWELSVNAENLFNRERYFLPSDYSNQVYPGAPINVFATVRLRFQ